MTWTKLSDDFSDDCWQLSDAAWRLHAEGLIWSNRKLLDLRLAKDEMRLWAKRPDAAEELVAVGWWRDEGDHYLIVHHGTYQRTREVTLKLQERNQRNGARGGRPPKVPRERSPRNPDGNPSGNPDGNPKGRDGTGSYVSSYSSELTTQGEKKNSGTGKNGAAGYTQTSAELRRIDANVRDGYDQ